MTLRRRYLVQYAHYDGNVYDVGEFATRLAAEAAVDAERTWRRAQGQSLVVFMTDRDNPERGDVYGLEAED